jgi:prevent-host-death family protein
VSVGEAESLLADLVRRAEAGEEVILTRQGLAVVRLTPVGSAPDRIARRALFQAVRAAASAKARAGPSAARSQDFLYGDVP